MISSIQWVPAGVSAPVPKKYELSAAERELVDLMEQHGNIDDVKAELLERSSKKKASAKERVKSDLPDDLRMDEYSSDEDDAGMAVGQMLAEKTSGMTDILPEEDEERGSDDEEEEDVKLGDLRASDEDDDNDDDDDVSDDGDDDSLADVEDTREYMPVDVEGLKSMGFSHVGTNGAVGVGGLDEGDDDSDIEEVKLTADDAVVVVAKTEDDFATLEVHVYDRNSGNLYVHHDIPLPSYPLCLAHGQVGSSAMTGNYCAVGTFSPGIEIWNLDVLNALEPSCTLGGEDTSAVDDMMRLRALNGASGQKQPPQKRRNGGLRPGSHTDAVMSLSWNQIHKQVIASGSADCTVKLWDVTKADVEAENCNAATFTHHRGKVQSVLWHPKEGTLLATGSYDRTVALLDARSNGKNVKKVKTGADCEAMAWDPFNSEYLTVACEDGTVSCWDVRKFETSSPLWSFVASEFGVNGISYNQHVPGMLAMCSVDKTVSLWDAYCQQKTPTNEHPRSCGSKDMASGKLYTVSFYPSDPWLLGCGGSGNQLALWDMSSEEIIQKRFLGRMEGAQGASLIENTEEPDENDFDKMMTVKESAATTTKTANVDQKEKKRKAKGKRGAHAKGR